MKVLTRIFDKEERDIFFPTKLTPILGSISLFIGSLLRRRWTYFLTGHAPSLGSLSLFDAMLVKESMYNFSDLLILSSKC